MKFEHTLTSNWENAFRGLRHPLESYKKSDSKFGLAPVDYMNDIEEDFVNIIWEARDEKDENPYGYEKLLAFYQNNDNIKYDPRYEIYEYALLGPNDLDLAQRMIKAGTPNDKFLRQIFVSVDITAPLYLWKELDTYKVGTTANSTSTMHKLASTPITLDCFEIDDYDDTVSTNKNNIRCDSAVIIQWMEDLRQKYNETKDIRYWKELIRWLPESWLQTRTWTANYSVLRNIYHWRRTHKLTEWHSFCHWVEGLPYAEKLITFDNK